MICYCEKDEDYYIISLYKSGIFFKNKDLPEIYKQNKQINKQTTEKK